MQLVKGARLRNIQLAVSTTIETMVDGRCQAASQSRPLKLSKSYMSDYPPSSSSSSWRAQYPIQPRRRPMQHCTVMIRKHKTNRRSSSSPSATTLLGDQHSSALPVHKLTVVDLSLEDYHARADMFIDDLVTKLEDLHESREDVDLEFSVWRPSS